MSTNTISEKEVTAVIAGNVELQSISTTDNNDNDGHDNHNNSDNNDHR